MRVHRKQGKLIIERKYYIRLYKYSLFAFYSKGKTKSIKESNDLVSIVYHNSYWISVVLRNFSKFGEHFVDISCSNSENCLISENVTEKNLKIKPMKARLAAFLTPFSQNKEWIGRCSYLFRE
jgi:hypothetical protein